MDTMDNGTAQAQTLPQPQLQPQSQSPSNQEPTTTMLSPSGDIADIPQSRAAEAATKGGYKLAVDMVGKDGKPAVIPTDRAHEAMAKGGYTLKNPDAASQVASATAARPQEMQTQGLVSVHQTPEFAALTAKSPQAMEYMRALHAIMRAGLKFGWKDFGLKEAADIYKAATSTDAASPTHVFDPATKTLSPVNK